MRSLHQMGYFHTENLRKLNQLYIRNESLSTLYSLYCILIYIQSAYLQPVRKLPLRQLQSLSSELQHSYHIDCSSRPVIYL